MTLYQKRVSIGNFLKKGEDYKDGDVVTIASEGKPVEGDYGTRQVFLIKLADGREGNVNFNQTTINNLVDSYGNNSVNWIGKEVKIIGVLSNVQGKMIKVYYFLHPDTILNEASGEFVIPGRLSEEDKVNAGIGGHIEDVETPF